MKTIKESRGQYVVTDNTKAIHIVKQRNGKWLAYAAYNKSMVTDELDTMSKTLYYARHMLLND